MIAVTPNISKKCMAMPETSKLLIDWIFFLNIFKSFVELLSAISMEFRLFVLILHSIEENGFKCFLVDVNMFTEIRINNWLLFECKLESKVLLLANRELHNTYAVIQMCMENVCTKTLSKQIHLKLEIRLELY